MERKSEANSTCTTEAANGLSARVLAEASTRKLSPEETMALFYERAGLLPWLRQAFKCIDD